VERRERLRACREELSHGELLERINTELASYPAAAGCLVYSVRRVAVQSPGACNWVADRVVAAADANVSYLPILARVIHDFQQRYALPGIQR